MNKEVLETIQKSIEDIIDRLEAVEMQDEPYCGCDDACTTDTFEEFKRYATTYFTDIFDRLDVLEFDVEALTPKKKKVKK